MSYNLSQTITPKSGIKRVIVGTICVVITNNFAILSPKNLYRENPYAANVPIKTDKPVTTKPSK